MSEAMKYVEAHGPLAQRWDVEGLHLLEGERGPYVVTRPLHKKKGTPRDWTDLWMRADFERLFVPASAPSPA
jgi:hypothetical protein